MGLCEYGPYAELVKEIAEESTRRQAEQGVADAKEQRSQAEESRNNENDSK